ncbi:hypothetical protein Lal_00030229 [Lupinus albus]|nr:hypothetical protein Lal_00030229 [Lupinus albus]
MVAESEDDPKTFSLILDMILARTMTLRVKVQPSYNQCSVIILSENPVLIKSIVDQFGILEVILSDDVKRKHDVNDIIEYECSFSIIADHGPNNLQVVTPVKRTTDDLNLDILQSPIYKSTQLSSSKVAKQIKTE